VPIGSQWGWSHRASVEDEGDMKLDVRFEVFTAVTMENGVFWVVTPCGSCKFFMKLDAYIQIQCQADAIGIAVIVAYIAYTGFGILFCFEN
jgi:hypothetical protein